MTKPKTWEEGLEEVMGIVQEVLRSHHWKYGRGNISFFGELGVLIRATDKVERLKHLQEIEEESIDDTWMDLAGYAIIALMWRKGYWELPQRG